MKQLWEGIVTYTDIFFLEIRSSWLCFFEKDRLELCLDEERDPLGTDVIVFPKQGLLMFKSWQGQKTWRFELRDKYLHLTLAYLEYGEATWEDKVIPALESWYMERLLLGNNED